MYRLGDCCDEEVGAQNLDENDDDDDDNDDDDNDDGGDLIEGQAEEGEED